mmetsp:Transcript_5440/g.7567  ORF Transcript_5440/g.7567 Transcript_5440/m.7567 type:complete len:87 (-) Transcript_5440:496-756(-)
MRTDTKGMKRNKLLIKRNTFEVTGTQRNLQRGSKSKKSGFDQIECKFPEYRREESGGGIIWQNEANLRKRTECISLSISYFMSCCR